MAFLIYIISIPIIVEKQLIPNAVIYDIYGIY